MKVETIGIDNPMLQISREKIRTQFLIALNYIVGHGGKIINITQDTDELKRAYVLVPRSWNTDSANPFEWKIR